MRMKNHPLSFYVADHAADPRARGVFSNPDLRGNNPHGTYETADEEGRRLNAKRYETVGQVEEALDRRTQALMARRQMGEMPEPWGAYSSALSGAPSSAPSGGLGGVLLLIGLGAVIGYFLTRKDGESDEEGVEEAAAQPNGMFVAPAPVVTPVGNSTPPKSTRVQVSQPTPPQMAAPKRRRRRAKSPEASPTATPTQPVL